MLCTSTRGTKYLSTSWRVHDGIYVFAMGVQLSRSVGKQKSIIPTCLHYRPYKQQASLAASATRHDSQPIAFPPTRLGV